MTVSLTDSLLSSLHLIYLPTLFLSYSTTYQALLDSDATVNLVNQSIVKHHRIPIASEFSSLPMVLTDGSMICHAL